MPYRMTPSVRHRAIEVHYYIIIISQGERWSDQRRLVDEMNLS